MYLFNCCVVGGCIINIAEDSYSYELCSGCYLADPYVKFDLLILGMFDCPQVQAVSETILQVVSASCTL